MTRKNPFPGMNPFFEQQWGDAHTMLIAYVRDALQERLPEDLVIRAEEEAEAVGAEKKPKSYRPDIQVRAPWTVKEPAGTALAAKASDAPATPVTEPSLVRARRGRDRSLAGNPGNDRTADYGA